MGLLDFKMEGTRRLGPAPGVAASRRAFMGIGSISSPCRHGHLPQFLEAGGRDCRTVYGKEKCLQWAWWRCYWVSMGAEIPILKRIQSVRRGIWAQVKNKKFKPLSFPHCPFSILKHSQTNPGTHPRGPCCHATTMLDVSDTNQAERASLLLERLFDLGYALTHQFHTPTPLIHPHQTDTDWEMA